MRPASARNKSAEEGEINQESDEAVRGFRLKKKPAQNDKTSGSTGSKQAR